MLELKSRVLMVGKGCPVCEGEKSEKARTCRVCLNRIGPRVTKAVDYIAEAATEAGWANIVASVNGGIKRSTVWGPIYAMVKVPLEAKQVISKNMAIESYFEVRQRVAGGHMEIFVFGYGLMPGGVYPAMVELKRKLLKEAGWVHYIRVQVIGPDNVPEGDIADLESDIRLAIHEYNRRKFLGDMPWKQICERGRQYSVGFVPKFY